MVKLIAETAWHHEGDYSFMSDLVTEICEESAADIIKLHITLNLDEYMSKDHDAYMTLKSWMLTAQQWESLIEIVRRNGKELLLLLNDTTAIEFASEYSPDLVELHSVCLNVPRLQESFLEKINENAKFIIGVGGCTLQEVDAAINVFRDRETILMFGFQNYPTRYEDVNLKKIKKIQSLYSNNLFGYADHTAWDEKNNELITLLVSANSMSYVEKHVTIQYGQERCDYSAAISIDMFNKLASKLEIMEQLSGSGVLGLNQGERSYSFCGVMKMAAVTNCDLKKNSALLEKNINFCRTGQISNMSQIDVCDLIGSQVTKNVRKGQVLKWDYFE